MRNNYCFRQEVNNAQEMYPNDYINQYLSYNHENQVKAEVVHRPEDYRYSWSIDYAGDKGLLVLMVV